MTKFLLLIHSNYGPFSYSFRDKRRFLSKIANFPIPAPLGEFHSNFVTAVALKNYTHAPSRTVETEFDDIYICLKCVRKTTQTTKVLKHD